MKEDVSDLYTSAADTYLPVLQQLLQQLFHILILFHLLFHLRMQISLLRQLQAEGGESFWFCCQDMWIWPDAALPLTPGVSDMGGHGVERFSPLNGLHSSLSNDR
jgi:hypothetical protein